MGMKIQRFEVKTKYQGKLYCGRVRIEDDVLTVFFMPHGMKSSVITDNDIESLAQTMLFELVEEHMETTQTSAG